MIGRTATNQNSIKGAEIAFGDDANSEIADLIANSETVLNFTAEINDDNKANRAVGIAVGINEVDGEPKHLVLSFAVEHMDDDKVIVDEEKRTTILLPIGNAFTFGNGVVAVCDALHDYYEEKREELIKQGVQNIINDLRGNQKPE